MLIILCLTIITCGSIQLREDTKPVLVDIAASTAGYLLGKESPELINPLSKWADKLNTIKLGKEIEFNNLIEIGFMYVDEDPFLELQLNNVLKLFMIDVDLTGSLTEETILLMNQALKGFKEGLEAARLELRYNAKTR